MNPFLRYLADKHSARTHTDRQTDRQTDRHTPMTTRPCGLRRAGNNSAYDNTTIVRATPDLTVTFPIKSVTSNGDFELVAKVYGPLMFRPMFRGGLEGKKGKVQHTPPRERRRVFISLSTALSP